VFYGNNIFSNISSVVKQGVSSFLVNSANLWDNGSIGNYWSNYLEKYANASEIDDSGIGDTPYIIDAHNIDRYPLMYPYDIEKNTVMFPPQKPQPEPFPTTLLIASVIINSCCRHRSANLLQEAQTLTTE
jgi:nitrous oxidase accessory protein NosD